MLCSSLLAAALTVTAGGDAFMVQGFPQEYKPDKTLTEWIGSGSAAATRGSSTSRPS